jgi:hypothetical protein
MPIADEYPQLHPQVAGRIIDGEAVVVLPQEGQIEVLNEVGARIWELIDGLRSVRDIAQAIVDEYEVDMDCAVQDVKEFIQELVRDGAVVLAERPGTG